MLPALSLSRWSRTANGCRWDRRTDGSTRQTIRGARERSRAPSFLLLRLVPANAFRDQPTRRVAERQHDHQTENEHTHLQSARVDVGDAGETQRLNAGVE